MTMLAKIDADLFEQMLVDDLDSTAAFVHLASISWLYARMKDDCRIPAALGRMGVAPGVDPAEAEAGATRLVEVGYWTRHDDGSYELINHADVIRQEIGNRRKKASRDRDAQVRLRTGVNALVIARDGGTCQACSSTENLTVDHKFPQIRGGCSDPLNLQALCRRCNSGKGDRVLPGVRCCGARSPRCDGQETPCPSS